MQLVSHYEWRILFLNMKESVASLESVWKTFKCDPQWCLTYVLV